MKKERTIKKKTEFTRIIQARQYVNDESLALYWQPKEMSDNRVGLSVTTKLGNAVERNRAKRQVRSMIDEIFDWQENFDAVVIIRNNFNKFSFAENKKRLERIYKKVRMKDKGKERINEETI